MVMMMMMMMILVCMEEVCVCMWCTVYVCMWYVRQGNVMYVVDVGVPIYEND